MKIEFDVRTEPVNVQKIALGAVNPKYHCACEFCKKFVGELARSDGTHYSRNDRRAYYSRAELANARVGQKGGHLAKTPLHIARWAVQQYTRPDDWVLDPTAGAGTTLVEALNHGRNAAGMELEFIDVIGANIAENNPKDKKYVVWQGDARAIGARLAELGKKFKLVVNNPPYWGDQSQKGKGVREGYEYDKSLPNIAFLKEGDEYYETMGLIYAACAKHMAPSGRLVIGVKDQMRNKAPDGLHQKLALAVRKHCTSLAFEGVAVLKHHPTTLFLNTYFRQFGVHPPYHQTIMVFKKG